MRAGIEQLRGLKQQLTRLQMEVPKDFSDAARQQRASQSEQLSKQVEQLEGDMARRVAGLDVRAAP